MYMKDYFQKPIKTFCKILFVCVFSLVIGLWVNVVAKNVKENRFSSRKWHL